jgi:O-antigen ligase
MTLVRPRGYLNWAPPAMIMLAAAEVLLSGRDVSQNYAELAGDLLVRHPVMPWVQRAVSLLLLLIAIERIAHHFIARKPVPSISLAVAYVLYWTASVAAPALFGAHPLIGHEYAYSLIIGLAALLVTTEEIADIVDAARNALFGLMLVSVLLIPVSPTMVIDVSYTQGLLPGVPRLGGLAPHPVALGMFAQTALLLLWARPLRWGWVNVLAWLLGLTVLFVAQSKAAWIAFVLCSLAMVLVRHGPSAWRRLGDPREDAFGIIFCLGAIVTGAVLLSLLLLTDLGGRFSDFLETQQGAQLMSLTGRDKIWAIAISEWEASKFFGYGPGLFDDAFRQSIGMPNATNAHNQFMDTLARAGGVGAAFLVIYACVLLVLSVRYARRTAGLSLALFVALTVRSISEVPLNLFGYGTEFFAHLLLIATLAAGASVSVQATAARRRPMYGVPA